VAVDGFIAVFGHPGVSSVNPNFTSGYVHVRRRDQNGNWVLTQITPSSPQANQRFGHSVAIVAGAVAVGSPALDVTHTGNGTVFTDAGGAYVFELTGDTWDQVARLVEPDADLWTSVGYGHAVAISGADPATPDRMLVSSQRNRNAPGSHLRSYTRTNNVWTPRQVFTSNTDDCYGCTMALDGNWAAIGAPDSQVTASFAGKVTVLRFANNFLSLISSTDRFDSQGGTNDTMGSTVSIDRDGPTLFVGSPGAEVYGNSSEGVVLVGRGGDFGDPVPRAIRTLDLGQGLTNANYGGAIASDGDTLVIGALGEDVTVQQDRGAVYVMQRDASGNYNTLTPLRLLAPDGSSDDQFGLSVTLRGDSLLIGAANRSVQGVHEAGTVYAFRRSNGVWNLEVQLIAPMPSASGGFGAGLDFDGSTAVICGRFIDISWVFERNSNGTWTWVQDLDQRCNTPHLAGDLLILGDPFADLAASEVGKVSTYVRTGNQWQFQSALTGNNSGQRFGAHTALHGDLLSVASNGDGALPLQVFRRVGAAWLPEVSLLPNDATAESYCVASAINTGRVFLGCGNFPGPTGTGATYVFEKLGSNWAQTQKLVHPTPREGDNFGGVLHTHADGTLFVAAVIRAVNFFGQGMVYRYTEPALLSNGFE
jgi:hypothetical protein